MAPLNLLAPVAAGLALVMALAWAVQRVTRNIGWVDVFWTVGTGLAGILLALAPWGSAGPGPRRLAIAGLVALWSLRLAIYVAARVARGPEDGRYKNIRAQWGATLQPRLFWFLELQALVGWLLAVAILLAAHNPVPGLRVLDVAAVVVLVTAILGETLADRQLQRFKADPANHGRVCDVGLWSWSRHPNYFFEWLGWVAYPLFAIAPGGGHAWGWFACVGPALMYAVLVHGTGIPPLEEHMLRSRGAAYRQYQLRTNAFFPAPPRAAAEGGSLPEN